MKIDDLIDRLRDKNGTNGVYEVLRSQYESLKEWKRKRDAPTASTTNFIFANNRVNEHYQFIFGLLYGLRAAEYLTQDELTELCTEFREATY